MDSLADQPAPKLKAPPGTTDCHIHVYDEKLPLAPTATFKPPHTTVEEYMAVRKLLGIERTVVVAPTAYGKDNTLLLDTMKKIGPSARGVVTIDNTTTDAEFDRLHKLGVRGVRFFMFFPAACSAGTSSSRWRRGSPSAAGASRSRWTAANSPSARRPSIGSNATS